MPSRVRTKRTHNKQQYGENRDKILADRKEAYGVNSESKKMASKIASKQAYDKNPDAKKFSTRVAAKQAYDKNPAAKKLASKQAYDKNLNVKRWCQGLLQSRLMTRTLRLKK